MTAYRRVPATQKVVGPYVSHTSGPHRVRDGQDNPAFQPYQFLGFGTSTPDVTPEPVTWDGDQA